MSPWAILVSQFGVSALIAVVGSVAILFLGLAIDGAHGPVSPIDVLVAFAVCATAFVAIGIFLGAVMPTARPHRRSGSSCSSCPR